MIAFGCSAEKMLDIKLIVYVILARRPRRILSEHPCVINSMDGMWTSLSCLQNEIIPSHMSKNKHWGKLQNILYCCSQICFIQNVAWWDNELLCSSTPYLHSVKVRGFEELLEVEYSLKIILICSGFRYLHVMGWHCAVKDDSLPSALASVWIQKAGTAALLLLYFYCGLCDGFITVPPGVGPKINFGPNINFNMSNYHCSFNCAAKRVYYFKCVITLAGAQLTGTSLCYFMFLDRVQKAHLKKSCFLK